MGLTIRLQQGTTWTQELVWLVANDLNFEQAKSTPLLQRFPFVELNIIRETEHLRECINEFTNGLLANEKINRKSWIDYLDSISSPRFLKTHLAILLPKFIDNHCKVIYVARNPKDVVVSYYHYHKAVKFFNCKMDISQFTEYFMKDLTMYSPFMDHVKFGWEQRNKPNVLFLFYEDLKQDLSGCIKRVCEFYDKTYDNFDLERLVEHLEFKNFQNNPMVNTPKPGKNDVHILDPRSFVRKGKIGSWKEEFPPDLVRKFDKWLAEKLADTDIIFAD
ncbi:sulfotransferase 1B1-like isoform X2 [Prorops nasuta]|uniref:sulfotransferase 1B1-like isoform X2 n=1 Tax=Prorops nasuta TaxID=863751 RepID=UPI0034CE4A30